MIEGATQLEQAGEVLPTERETEVLGVAEHHFGVQDATILLVLLEGAVFVVDADRRLHTFAQHPGVELIGSTLDRVQVMRMSCARFPDLTTGCK